MQGNKTPKEVSAGEDNKGNNRGEQFGLGLISVELGAIFIRGRRSAPPLPKISAMQNRSHRQAPLCDSSTCSSLSAETKRGHVSPGRNQITLSFHETA